MTILRDKQSILPQKRLCCNVSGFEDRYGGAYARRVVTCKVISFENIRKIPGSQYDWWCYAIYLLGNSGGMQEHMAVCLKFQKAENAVHEWTFLDFGRASGF